MALLRFIEVRDRAAQLAVESAIRAADPGASITADWTTGLVDVAGAMPTEDLCATLRLTGFSVEALVHRPRVVTIRDFLMLLVEALGFALVAGAGGTILGGMLGALYVRLNPNCDSVTDGGSCTSVVIVIAVGAAAICAFVVAAVTIVVGTLRLAHIRRTGEDVPFLRI